MSTFDSTKVPLKDILLSIKQGKTQLPDFQRGWVWDDDHIRALLVSIARSFPVGAVMLLETGGDVRFQVRPIEGVDLQSIDGVRAEDLVLDGQQRLTSLFQVLACDQPVQTRDTKKNPIERYYYWDIRKALTNPESLEDAIVAVDKSRQLRENFGRDVKLDLTSTELECTQLHFPCNQVFQSNAWETALYKYAADLFPVFMEFRTKVLESGFREYQVPVIRLKRDTTKEAVCLVFEKVNTGGVPLSVFELVTAGYAADGFNLRDDWFGSKQRNVMGRQERFHKEPILRSIESTDFLQAITILHTRKLRDADVKAGKQGNAVTGVSAKRSAVLGLPLDAYATFKDSVTHGFLLAAKFLRGECFFGVRDLPYRSQIVPLAAVLSQLGERYMEPRIKDKLCRWFWCGIFGELYGSAIEFRIAQDTDELLAWIFSEGPEPRTIQDANFHHSRIDTLRSRLAAAYKGLHVLILRSGCRDFFWKETVKAIDSEGWQLDIHHIFPKDWCEANGISPSVYNSIANKTPISFKANRMIGGKAPSAYLEQIQGHPQVKLDPADMDELLRSHFCQPVTMRTDDFQEFFRTRKEALLDLVEQVMGKRISRADPAMAGGSPDLGDADEDAPEED